MHRRSFIKQASLAVLASSATRSFAAEPKRIAFGGIQIECSTYGDTLSRMPDFRIVRGKDLGDSRQYAFLKQYPYPFMPTLVASATPGGRVERATYDELKADFLKRLRELLPLDGLYLPMHGAMYVDGLLDAEGDWMAAARDVVGPECLVTASYDLHGNVSQRVIDQLDGMSAFRTAPHIDREETFRRACDVLIYGLEHKVRPTVVWAPIPVLMPGERSSTEYQPAKRLWAHLPSVNARPGILDASLLVGYVWADEPRATASAVMTGTDANALHQAAREVAQQYWDARKEFQFGVPTGTMVDIVKQALALNTKPVVISDSGDNPTGGGTGDRADALSELMRMNVTSAVVAGIADRPATLACYEAGAGKTIPLKIGATLDPARSRPIDVTARVVFLAQTDNVPDRQAVVDVNGVSVVLTARRRPFHLPKDFTTLGLDPTSFKIVVVKAGYLVPEIAAFANPNLMALTDGAVNQDIPRLSNVHRVPSYPWVQDLSFAPTTRLSARAGRK